MAKYLFVYHGGGMAPTEEERNAAMAAWGEWFGQLGAAVTDMGAPVGQVQTVGGDGAVSEAGNGRVTGYTLIEAGDIAAASDLAKGCPIFDSGGTVEVAELLQM